MSSTATTSQPFGSHHATWRYAQLYAGEHADTGIQEVAIDMHDDDLIEFEAVGAAPLPIATEEGYLEHDGAQIWYASYGSGAPVILLHGGLGHSGNWGYQVPTLVRSGYRAVLVDSRGHGRSTRDARPYSYDLMASDVVAVMDALGLGRAAVVGGAMAPASP